MIELQNWNATNQTFDNFYRMLYSYNAQNKLSQILSQMYSNSNWSDSSASNYAYDANGNQSEVVGQYYSNGWINSNRRISEYEQYTEPVDDSSISAAVTSLFACPNPFRTQTTISIKSDSDGMAKLNIYNIKGQLVKSDDLRLDKGNDLKWNWNNTQAAGIYFVELRQDNQPTKTLKLIKY